MALLEQKVVAFAVSPSKTAAPWFKLLCFFVAQTTVAAIGALGVTTFVVFVKFEAFSDSWILTPKVAFAISVRFVAAGLWRKPHKGRLLSSRLWRLSLPFPSTSSSSSSTCFSSCSPDSGAMPATADFHFFLKQDISSLFFRWKEQKNRNGSAPELLSGLSFGCFGDFVGVTKVTWCYFLVKDLLHYELKLLCLSRFGVQRWNWMVLLFWFLYKGMAWVMTLWSNSSTILLQWDVTLRQMSRLKWW